MDAGGSTTQVGSVIRKVNRALVEADTRAELESAVCTILADSDPYVFAWFGEYDDGREAVVPTTSAGVEQGYLDGLTIPVHDPPYDRGPTATAVRTGELQILQDVREDPDYEPWREAALERGYRSSAAVPLCADGECHGVVNVYADRPGAFDDDERRLLDELGDTITTAIEGIVARARLAEQRDRFEMLAERISDAYYAVDTDWRITYWNEQMAERTDTPPGRVLGESLWDCFPELLGTTFEDNYRAAMRTNDRRTFEAYLDAPFGYWVEVDVYPDENGLSVFSREVTDRKVRERELERAERRLEAIVENTSEAIYIKDDEGNYRFINRVGAEVFGLDPEVVVGLNDEDLFEPESVESIREDDREVIATGEARTWERARYVDGEERVFIDNKFPYRDAGEEIVGVMGVSREITERKQYERLLEDRNEKLEVLNRVVRHDIRNDMQYLIALGERLAEGGVDDAEAYGERVAATAHEVADLTTTVRELMDVLLTGDEDPEPVTVAEVLHEQVDAARKKHDDAVVRFESLPDPDRTVYADGMLDSVFRNVLTNAVEHNDGPEPTVTVHTGTDEEWYTLRIADDGPGIPDDRKDEVFGKGEKGLDSPGSGIGLYLVNTLVESYGGEVWIEDNDPTGTVVVVRLRIAD